MQEAGSVCSAENDRKRNDKAGEGGLTTGLRSHRRMIFSYRSENF